MPFGIKTSTTRDDKVARPEVPGGVRRPDHQDVSPGLEVGQGNGVLLGRRVEQAIVGEDRHPFAPIQSMGGLDDPRPIVFDENCCASIVCVQIDGRMMGTNQERVGDPFAGLGLARGIGGAVGRDESEAAGPVGDG